MEASKMMISEETLRFKKLGRNKKAELRRRNVVELIRSKPVGTPITLAEFQGVCAYSSTTAAYELIKDMLKRGTIVRVQEGLNRHSYSVAIDAVTREKEKSDPLVAPPQKTLTDLAKDFAWEKNSDSLREFIDYMDSIELEIRRKVQA